MKNEVNIIREFDVSCQGNPARISRGSSKTSIRLKYLPLQPYTIGTWTAGNQLPNKITGAEEVCAMCRSAYKIQPDSS